MNKSDAKQIILNKELINNSFDELKVNYQKDFDNCIASFNKYDEETSSNISAIKVKQEELAKKYASTNLDSNNAKNAKIDSLKVANDVAMQKLEKSKMKDLDNSRNRLTLKDQERKSKLETITKEYNSAVDDAKKQLLTVEAKNSAAVSSEESRYHKVVSNRNDEITNLNKQHEEDVLALRTKFEKETEAFRKDIENANLNNKKAIQKEQKKFDDAVEAISTASEKLKLESDNESYNLTNKYNTEKGELEENLAKVAGDKVKSGLIKKQISNLTATYQSRIAAIKLKLASQKKLDDKEIADKKEALKSSLEDLRLALIAETIAIEKQMKEIELKLDLDLFLKKKEKIKIDQNNELLVLQEINDIQILSNSNNYKSDLAAIAENDIIIKETYKLNSYLTELEYQKAIAEENCSSSNISIKFDEDLKTLSINHLIELDQVKKEHTLATLDLKLDYDNKVEKIKYSIAEINALRYKNFHTSLNEMKKDYSNKKLSNQLNITKPFIEALELEYEVFIEQLKALVDKEVADYESVTEKLKGIQKREVALKNEEIAYAFSIGDKTLEECQKNLLTKLLERQEKNNWELEKAHKNILNGLINRQEEEKNLLAEHKAKFNNFNSLVTNSTNDYADSSKSLLQDTGVDYDTVLKQIQDNYNLISNNLNEVYTKESNKTKNNSSEYVNKLEAELATFKSDMAKKRLDTENTLKLTLNDIEMKSSSAKKEFEQALLDTANAKNVTLIALDKELEEAKKSFDAKIAEKENQIAQVNNNIPKEISVRQTEYSNEIKKSITFFIKKQETLNKNKK